MNTAEVVVVQPAMLGRGSLAPEVSTSVPGSLDHVDAPSATEEICTGQPCDDFICPISGQVMWDPVFTADGHCYDRAYIETWLRDHETSPSTNLRLPNKALIPNHLLRGQMLRSGIEVAPLHTEASDDMAVAPGCKPDAVVDTWAESRAPVATRQSRSKRRSTVINVGLAICSCTMAIAFVSALLMAGGCGR
eukprot:gnl/TRDRNA2_/TRDRNA2_42683_c0_seq1.p1 gnl/TRDRNA2_/TRDRNA2_42683_c0~~gnl/TRDRNA2_/TRDRNA2_42683_c0_seq1.p1  ORF type:complete len:192 (-),score=19.62 gnl/TRDRNA2_/TRDRNA2_42683_c0_seq1:223-798(-)